MALDVVVDQRALKTNQKVDKSLILLYNLHVYRAICIHLVKQTAIFPFLMGVLQKRLNTIEGLKQQLDHCWVFLNSTTLQYLNRS